MRIPHGTAPTSPTNGDVWTTTAGIFVRINNATVGPLGTGSTGVTTISFGTTGLTPNTATSGAVTVAGTLAVANGGTGITSFGTGIATWLGTPSSANLASAITDETGSGSLVFANTPTLVTPNIGAATGTSLSLSGSLTAATKSFDINHPTKEGMRLRYGSLEGPENGVYVRGKSKEKILALPDYWIGLVDADSITIQLTAIGTGTIYVDFVANNSIKVGGTAEEFYYFIQAERKDVDKLIVEY